MKKSLKINMLEFQAWLQSCYPALIDLRVSDNGEGGFAITWSRCTDLAQEAALRHVTEIEFIFTE